MAVGTSTRSKAIALGPQLHSSGPLKSSRAEALKSRHHVGTIWDEAPDAHTCSAALPGSRFAMSQLWLLTQQRDLDHRFQALFLSVLLKELGTYKSGFEASDFAGPLSCSTLIPHFFLTAPLYFSGSKCELSSS